MSGMSFLRGQLPRYLLSKYQLIWTVTFSALFSFVLILLSIPFSNNVWFALGGSSAFLFTIAFIVVSIAVVVVSKVLMFHCRNLEDFEVWKYILWDLVEIVLISLLYTFFTVQGDKAGIIDTGERCIGDIFLSALCFTLVCLGIPYVISALYLSLADRNNTIRLMNYSNVVSDAPVKPYEEKRITLFDSSGVLKFSIDSENLYYIESDDNYIKIWYTDSAGEVKQYMLRCPLKTVEESFADSDLVRCHRKYIVNITKVKILKAEKEGYKISLGLEGLDTIPISKTYEQNVLARFNSL